MTVLFRQNTKNLVISRCCFAEDGKKKMHQDSKRTCTAIVLFIRPFVWCRSRHRRCCGLLKLLLFGERRFSFAKIQRTWSFHVVVLQRTAKKETLFASSVKKISGFTRPHVIRPVADIFFSTLESGFIFFRIRCRIRRIRVDGSRIREKKGCGFKNIRIRVDGALVKISKMDIDSLAGMIFFESSFVNKLRATVNWWVFHLLRFS